MDTTNQSPLRRDGDDVLIFNCRFELNKKYFVARHYQGTTFDGVDFYNEDTIYTIKKRSPAYITIDGGGRAGRYHIKRDSMFNEFINFHDGSMYLEAEKEIKPGECDAYVI